MANKEKFSLYDIYGTEQYNVWKSQQVAVDFLLKTWIKKQLVIFII